MANFSLNRLPYLLKIWIFEHLLPEDLLKFLEINRGLRHYLLYNGPFQKTIQLVVLDSRTEDEGEDNQILVSFLEITIISDNDCIYHFELEEQSGATSTFRPQNITAHIRFPSTNSRLFRRLPFCQQLVVRVSNLFHGDQKTVKISLLDFLPRLRGKALEVFGLYIKDHRQGETILGCIGTRIDSRFDYNCENYSLLIDPILPTTEAKMIEIRSRTVDDFLRCQGNRALSYREGETVYTAITTSLTQDPRLITDRVDAPLVCQEIISKF